MAPESGALTARLRYPKGVAVCSGFTHPIVRLVFPLIGFKLYKSQSVIKLTDRPYMIRDFACGLPLTLTPAKRLKFESHSATITFLIISSSGNISPTQAKRRLEWGTLIILAEQKTLRPAKHPQRQQERQHSPHGHHKQSAGLGSERSAFEDGGAEGVVERR